MDNNKGNSYPGVPAGSVASVPVSSKAAGGIFAERYRVVAIESEGLVIRGIRSGEVMTIRNPDPQYPFTVKEYPVGKLIELSDPSRRVAD